MNQAHGSHAPLPVILEGRRLGYPRLVLISPPEDRNFWPPLERRPYERGAGIGLLTLVAFLIRHGWKFQPAREVEPKDLRDLLRKAVVGVSVNIASYGAALSIAALAREVKARCVVFGGPYASSRAAQILFGQADVDYVVVGQGEIAFWELMEWMCIGGERLLPRGALGHKPDGNITHPRRRRPLPLGQCVAPAYQYGLPGRHNSDGFYSAGVYVQDGPPHYGHVERMSWSRLTSSRLSVDSTLDSLGELHVLRVGSLYGLSCDFAAGGRSTTRWTKELIGSMRRLGYRFGWDVRCSAFSLSRNIALLGLLPAMGVRAITLDFGGRADPVVSSRRIDEVLRNIISSGLVVSPRWLVGCVGESSASLERTVNEAVSVIGLLKNIGAFAKAQFDLFIPWPGCRHFGELCRHYPGFRRADWVDPEQLMSAWYARFVPAGLQDALDAVVAVSREFKGEVESILTR